MHSYFVGRTSELSRLERLLEQSASGRGSLACLAGEAGIGKTRLLTEFARRAEARGFRVMWSQVIEDPVAPPFLPWRLALRDCALNEDPAILESDLGSGAADVADVVPELRDRLRLAPTAHATDPGASRIQLFDAVSRFLLAYSARRPIALLVDNAHRADRSSLQLLEYYCRQLAQSPALVLLSYRPSDVETDHPLHGCLEQCSRAARYEEIQIGGLDRAETAELMGAIAGHPVPGTVVDAVWNRGDGNPLFVSQVTAGITRRLATSGGPAASLDIEVPDTLRDVIAKRLDALSAPTLEALRKAAILGRDFETSLLASLCGISQASLLACVDEAIASGVIVSIGAGRLRFVHALFREALYGDQSLDRRVRIHHEAAQRIEERHALELDPWLPQLAYHWYEAARAGYLPQAVDYCRRAAQQALAGRAHVEARVQLEHALAVAETADNPDPGLRFDLLMSLGDAQFRSGQSEPGARTYLRAAILAERNAWHERLAHAVLSLQHVQGQLGIIHLASVPLHQLALGRLPADARAMRARLLASLASACRSPEHRARGLHAFDESIRIARELGDAAVLFECLSQALLALQPPEYAPRQAELLREAVAIAESTLGGEAALAACSAVLFSLSKLGAYDELQSVLHRLHERADAARHPHYRQVAAGFEAQIAILQGHWLDAVRWARASLQQGGVDGSTGVEGRFGFQMFEIQRALGNLDSVAALFAQVATGGAGRLWMPGAILLHCELGHADEARRLLERLGDIGRLPRDDLYTTSLVYLAEACALLRDATRCEQLYTALQPYRALNLSVLGTVALGSGAGYLALLASALKRGREARQLFQEALAFNGRIGSRPLVARTQLDYARLLQHSDRPADRELAGRLIREAAATAAQFGMRRLAARADQMRAGDAEMESLTEREVEVLREIAAGSSNKRISASLGISLTTVATHIRSILRKTGTANRTEAVAHAHRSNLINQ
jgi:DNA-binding CsgD family transcriptional regulator